MPRVDATWDDDVVFLYVEGTRVATLTAHEAHYLARALETCAAAVCPTCKTEQGEV